MALAADDSPSYSSLPWKHRYGLDSPVAVDPPIAVAAFVRVVVKKQQLLTVVTISVLSRYSPLRLPTDQSPPIRTSLKDELYHMQAHYNTGSFFVKKIAFGERSISSRILSLSCNDSVTKS